MNMKIIEIIASTVEDCVNIQKGGAHRIELVSALEVGGLTPSYGLIEQAVKSVTIPINVMIRPHSYGFVYSKEDIEVMIGDIRVCKELKVSGIVLGVLTHQKTIDVEVMTRLLLEAEGLDVTFHKAFDETTNIIDALQSLQQLKQVKRVLTQGGTNPILENFKILEEIITKKD